MCSKGVLTALASTERVCGRKVIETVGRSNNSCGGRVLNAKRGLCSVYRSQRVVGAETLTTIFEGMFKKLT